LGIDIDIIQIKIMINRKNPHFCTKLYKESQHHPAAHKSTTATHISTLTHTDTASTQSHNPTQHIS